jgi:hypothetical protein
MANGTKISRTITGPFILDPSDNPLTITTAGAITSTGMGKDGIDGDASAPGFLHPGMHRVDTRSAQR